MPTGPAARIMDPVMHPLPPVLTGGPPSKDVIIGFKPAWLGVPAAAGAALQAAQAVAEQALQVVENTAKAGSATPAGPGLRAAAEAAKGAAAAAMGGAISAAAAGGSSLHACTTPWPVPPHGPGVVIDGSKTVFIDFLPPCRQGDTIIEAIGPPNKIAMGFPTVVIGG